jgi:tryptophan-rich sensory protein
MNKLKFKPNYIVIPLITVVVILLGSLFNSFGMQWYETQLVRPDLTPPNYAFPIAWNIIFLCTTISALMVWNKPQFEERYLVIFKRKAHDFKLIIGLFIANAVLNVLWSLLFFSFRLIYIALFEMLFLEATIILLVILIWKHSKIASLLLLPYLLWVGFATYLTYMINILN